MSQNTKPKSFKISWHLGLFTKCSAMEDLFVSEC